MEMRKKMLSFPLDFHRENWTKSGATNEDFFQYKAVWAAAVGINFMSEKGNLFLDSWEKLTKKNKLGSLSFTPEQALITAIFGQLNLQSCTTKLPWINSPHEITEETVLFWDHSSP